MVVEEYAAEQQFQDYENYKLVSPLNYLSHT